MNSPVLRSPHAVCRFAVFFLLAATAIPLARADDYRWEGPNGNGGNGDFNTPDWFDVTTQKGHTGPPLAIDGAYIPDGSVVTCTDGNADRFFTSPASGVLSLSGTFNVNTLGSLDLTGGGSLSAAVVQAVTVGGVADAGASVSVTGAHLTAANVVSVPTLAVGNGGTALFTANSPIYFNTVHVYAGSSLSLPGANLLWAGGRIDGGSALVAKTFGPGAVVTGSSGDMAVDGAGTTVKIGACAFLAGNLTVTGGAAMALDTLDFYLSGAQGVHGSNGLVSGAGSRMVASIRLGVNDGFSTLTVDDGGLVQSDQVDAYANPTHPGIVVSNGSTLRSTGLMTLTSSPAALAASGGSQIFAHNVMMDSLSLDGASTLMSIDGQASMGIFSGVGGQSNTGTQSSVTITNGATMQVGTANAPLGTSSLTVGHYGGALTVSGGAALNLIGANVPLAVYSSSLAPLDVASGGALTAQGLLNVLYGGTLNVEGNVDTIGNLTLGSGTLNVSGGGAFAVGRGDGNVLNVGVSYPNFEFYPSANVVVTGPGSSATFEGTTAFGSNGNTTVNGGAALYILTGVLGYGDGTGGALNVYNAGSSMTVTRTFAVGGVLGSAPGGSGSLGVNDGATVTVGRELSVSATGPVSVAAAPLPDGTTPVSGGRVLVGTDKKGAVGTIRVGHGGLLTGRATKPAVSALTINVTGNVAVGDGGEFRPGGGGPDVFTIQGDCDLSDGGSVGGETKFGLARTGTAGKDYDELIVGGTATLGGKLTLTLLPGYVPAIGDTFQLVQARSVAGGFTQVNTPGLTVNAVPNATGLTVTVTGVTPLAAPTITSATAANGTVGEVFAYQIAAGNTPAGYTAAGLPAGLDVDPASGYISGVPTAAGTFPVTLKATNTGGTGTATLTLAIVPPPDFLAQITSALTATAVVNQNFSYQITTASTPTTFAAIGIPPGVVLDSVTGVLSGRPTQLGTFPITLQANNDYGTATATLTLTVGTAAATPPTVTVVAGSDGLAFEGASKGKVLIERTGDTSAPLIVFYKVKGSATAGVDYKPLTGTVTIPAGASKAKVKLKPIDNATHDGTRKAKVKLLPASDGSYTVGDPFVAKIKIIDND